MASLHSAYGNSFKKALDNAESAEQALNAFKAMEIIFVESDLGMECFIVAEKLFKLHEFEQALCFGNRALTILPSNDDTRSSCLLIVDVLRLMGNSCFHLKKYDESLSYLNRANTKLTKLLENGNEEENGIVLEILLGTEMELYNVKDEMGSREEAVVHAVKALEITEKKKEEGCIELGDAYMGVSIAYLRAFDHEGALPFCLKALGIFEKQCGTNSMEVAEARRNLAVIYQDKREYDKSLELNQLAVTVLKKTSPGFPELMIAEIEGAYTMIELGQYEEAVNAMKGVVSRDDVDGWLRVKSFLTMAKALCYLEKFVEAEAYISVARKMLEEKEMQDPMLVPIGFSDLALLYEKKNDMETAILMIKNALALPRLPQKLLLYLCEALMFLISKSGKEKEEVPYLEDEVLKLKVSFGPEHCVVGYGFSNLGVAYLGAGEKELGAKSLANAKNILDVTLGPSHLTSLKIRHSLSVAYATLGRYHEGIEIEEKVVEGLKEMAPSEQLLLDEAVKHLSDMKGRVTESPTRASSQSKDDEDIAAKISQGGNADEENVI